MPEDRSLQPSLPSLNESVLAKNVRSNTSYIVYQTKYRDYNASGYLVAQCFTQAYTN